MFSRYTMLICVWFLSVHIPNSTQITICHANVSISIIPSNKKVKKLCDERRKTGSD